MCSSRPHWLFRFTKADMGTALHSEIAYDGYDGHPLQ